MKSLNMAKFAAFTIVAAALTDRAFAQYDLGRIASSLKKSRAPFVNSLPSNLAIDDERVVLRAYLLKLVVCQVESGAAETLCRDIRNSEDLDAQNPHLTDFGASPKNMEMILRAVIGTFQSVKSVLPNRDQQINGILTQLATALALSNNPEQAARKALDALKAASSLTDALGSSPELRAYLALVTESNLWLELLPAGRREPWMIKAAKVIDEKFQTCRVTETGKFRCWRKVGNQREIVPTTNEDGFTILAIPPHHWETPGAYCSQNQSGGFLCWIPAKDGADDERCTGSEVPAETTDLGDLGSYNGKDIVLRLKCPQSGDLAILINFSMGSTNDGLSRTGRWSPFRGAVRSSEEGVAWHDTSKVIFNFWNYNCQFVINGSSLTCANLTGKRYRLFRASRDGGLAEDMGEGDALAGFFPSKQKEWAEVSENLICVSSRAEYLCRAFFVEERGIVYLDFSFKFYRGLHGSLKLGSKPGSSYIVETIASKPTIRLILPSGSESEGYRVRVESRQLDLGVTERNSVGLYVYDRESGTVCFDTNRRTNDGYNDIHDSNWLRGLNNRCVLVNQGGNRIANFDVPFRRSMRDVMFQIGGTICLADGFGWSGIRCDFPSAQMFRPPLFEMDSVEDKPTLEKKVAALISMELGYFCRQDPAGDLACYNLNRKSEPRPKKLDEMEPISYKLSERWRRLIGATKFDLRLLHPGELPWLCEDTHLIQRCQQPGENPRVLNIRLKPN